MTVDFSGTAGQVFAAFRTEIHYLEARGATHIGRAGAATDGVFGHWFSHEPRPRHEVAKRHDADDGRQNQTIY